jgi:hypothetical protein
MNWLDPWLLIPLAGLVLLVLAWWASGFGRQVHVERARELFRLQRKRLQELFLESARESEKPRGLLWIGCEFTGEPELARDRSNRGLVAFVPVAIEFAAIEGSDMEGLPAVAQPKQASALFTFVRGQWITSGKAVFNLAPSEAIHQFGRQYEPIPAGH